jgi:hypothetical protein
MVQKQFNKNVSLISLSTAQTTYISFDCDEIIEFNFLISGCERVERIWEFLPPHPIGTSLCPPLHHIGILSSGGRTNASVKTHPADTSLQANNNVNPEKNRQSGDYEIGESCISSDWRAKHNQ